MSSTPGTVFEVDTPALLLDWSAAENNLNHMSAFFANTGAALRPHFKNHKCPELARRQLLAGNAVGITCAKLAEAEVLVNAGFEDILVANQIIGQPKARRLVALNHHARVRAAVDCVLGIEQIAAEAHRAGITVGLLVEIDVGMGRCGVVPGEDAVALARLIDQTKGVQFDGLQAYEAHAIAMEDAAQRAQTAQAAMELALETRGLIEQSGIGCPIISGGGTGTYKTSGAIAGINEIQAGTYATMDWTYQIKTPEFHQALTVLATVISRAREGMCILDAGCKAVGHEFGPPKVLGRDDVEIPSFLSEEHTIAYSNDQSLKVGDKVRLVPSHACTTCNLHRQMIVHEADTIIDRWDISGSGAMT